MGILVGFIAFFAMVFGITYIFYTTRNKERMALIEKGADASHFSTGNQHANQFRWNKFTLKIGMLLMGIALGIFIAALLSFLNIIDEGALYTAMIFFF